MTVPRQAPGTSSGWGGLSCSARITGWNVELTGFVYRSAENGAIWVTLVPRSFSCRVIGTASVQVGPLGSSRMRRFRVRCLKPLSHPSAVVRPADATMPRPGGPARPFPGPSRGPPGRGNPWHSGRIGAHRENNTSPRFWNESKANEDGRPSPRPTWPRGWSAAAI
jgi:hypothetical protein